MLIECFESGPFATNGYLVGDKPGGSAMVVDAPQDSAGAMLDQARQWNVTITVLVNTHGHFDHVLDNAALLRQTKARFGIHHADEKLLAAPQARFFGLNVDIEPCQPGFHLEDGGTVAVGDLSFRVLHCPGHSPGSVALFEPSAGVVFVGDILFAGSVGRTDLPGGDYDALMQSIRQKLYPLGDHVRVLPGHGPSTTIGRERKTNPFLLAFESR